MSERVKVFVVAGNRLLREALGRILKRRSEITLLQASAIEPDCAAAIGGTDPDVVLINASAKDAAALQLIGELRQGGQGARILLIGVEEDAESFLRAVRMGISGYILQDASGAEVVAAVRAVARGESVCPPALCALLFQQVARQVPTPSGIQVRLQLGFTRREQQLLPLVERGMTNKEIAGQLSVSEQTVKNHLHRMMQKVGVNDRLAIVELWRMRSSIL